jgi:hypothetical protein
VEPSSACCLHSAWAPEDGLARAGSGCLGFTWPISWTCSASSSTTRSAGL